VLDRSGTRPFAFNMATLSAAVAITGEPSAKKLCTGLEAEKVLYTGFDGKKHEYCPYTETSKSYDNTRAPLGLNIIFGSMSLSETPLKEQRLADLGCGTGTFLERAMGKVGECSGLDYNEGMLEQAKNRLGDKVKLAQGSADSLPFTDTSFDACTMNQVIHHFPNDKEFSFCQRAFQEAFRVLKPGGCFVLNTSTPEQQRDAFWWLSLFPRASDAICSRFPPLNVLIPQLKSAGFEVNADSVTVPLRRTLMAEEKYLEGGVRCGFSAVYRAGDSSWSMAENFGELQEGLGKLQQMLDDGSADAWLQEREALRLSMGQATFITVRKPSVTG